MDSPGSLPTRRTPQSLPAGWTLPGHSPPGGLPSSFLLEDSRVTPHQVDSQVTFCWTCSQDTSCWMDSRVISCWRDFWVASSWRDFWVTSAGGAPGSLPDGGTPGSLPAGGTSGSLPTGGTVRSSLPDGLPGHSLPDNSQVTVPDRLPCHSLLDRLPGPRAGWTLRSLPTGLTSKSTSSKHATHCYLNTPCDISTEISLHIAPHIISLVLHVSSMTLQLLLPTQLTRRRHRLAFL